MLPHLWNDVGNVFIWGTAALLVFALAFYTVVDRWGWARNWAGRVLVGLTLTIIVIYVPSLIALADPKFVNFGASLWYQWVAFGTVCFSFVIAAAFVVTLEYIRRMRRKQEKDQATRLR